MLDHGFFYGYIVVVAAFFIMVVAFGVYVAFGVFFKPVLSEFGWTRATTAGAFSLAWIMQGLLAIFMGRLTDRLGPRIVMTVCSLLLGLGYLLMSKIGAVWQIYLFYGVIIGTGMSGIWVPIMSTVARWFIKRRSLMTGIVMAGAGIGVLITPPIANRLISIYDWRISYIILGSIVLVFVFLTAQFLRRDPTKVGQRPYGENKGEEAGLKLGNWEFSLKEAVYTSQFWMFCGMSFCLGFSAYVIMVHIAPHATELGISTASAANILATVGGLTIVGRVVLGTIADRIGNKQAFIIGYFLMAVALFWLVPVKEGWMLYLLAGVFGFAFGVGAASSPLVAELFGLSSHGLILGVTTLAYSIGGAVGPFVAGYIFDITDSYQVAFLVSAVLSIASVILASLLRPTGVEGLM